MIKLTTKKNIVIKIKTIIEKMKDKGVNTKSELGLKNIDIKIPKVPNIKIIRGKIGNASTV